MLFLRGLWWRRGFCAAVLAVGTLSAAVAALGPMYARAASESTLTDELTAAGSRAGMSFTSGAPSGDAGAVPHAVSAIGRSAALHGYGPAITGRSLLVTAQAREDEFSSSSTMVARDGLCAHVVITQGRCPAAAGDVVVPAETLQSAPRWHIGDTLSLHLGVPTKLFGIVDGPPAGQAHVVGAYRPRDVADPYWFGRPYFKSALGPSVASGLKSGLDALFVAPGQFAAAGDIVADVNVDVPLVPSHVRLADVAQLRRNVAAVQQLFPNGQAVPGQPSMRTDLTAVLADAARDEHQVDDATLVIVLELAALSVLVLFQVVGGAVAARGDEIALAKLRGLPPWRTVVFALAEPVTLLVVAAPAGFGVAYAVTRILTAMKLVSGTPVEITAPTGLALAAAFAGSAVAAVLAAFRTITRPVLEQWRHTGAPRHARRGLLLVDAVLAAAAVGALVQLRSGRADRPGAIFLLAPSLLVLAVALIGVRVLPWLARPALRSTRASRWIAAFLALRQTVRRPAGLRLGALLAVAAGLAVFAVCGEAVAQGNRTARAQTEVGTPRQLSVQFETGHDPQSVVDSVDPRGEWAMAAASWSPDGGPSDGNTVTGLLLGVEHDRLPAAAFRVRGQLPPATLASDISAAVRPSATFRGTALSVVIDTQSLQGDRPTVRLAVRAAHQLPQLFDAGPLLMGQHTYTAHVDCADGGCAFTGVTLGRSVRSQPVFTGAIRLLGVSASGTAATPVPVDLSSVTSWRGGQLGVGASVQLSGGGSSGIGARFSAAEASSPALNYADTPAVLPIVAAPRSTDSGSATGGVTDFLANELDYRVVRRVTPLPVVLDTGAIADLRPLRIALPNFDSESQWSVWLGPHAPADAVARLERAGLLVQHEQTESGRAAQLARQGPALGLLLLLVCAVAAAVLAVGGTAVALLAEGRRRAFELAALLAIGVRRPVLRRSAVVEQALLLGAAVVLGLPAGYAAARLVLPVVPEFSDSTPVVLRYVPSVLVAAACAAGFVALLAAVSVAAGVVMVRAAVPARLREGE